MAISRAFSIDGVTIGASEISVVSGTTTLQTRTETGRFALHVDAAALAKADYYIARYYEKVEATGGTKRLAFQQTISHAQAELWKLPDMLLKNGWDMTLQKVGGADAVFNADIWEIESVVQEPYEFDAVTVSTTELSFIDGASGAEAITDVGDYQLWLDASGMAKADVFDLKILEKVGDATNTQRLLWTRRLIGVQSELIWSPILRLGVGWDMRIVKVSGADVAFDASVRRVLYEGAGGSETHKGSQFNRGFN